MIGYNVKQINELLDKLDDSYKQIKKAMHDPWDGLSNTLQDEWIGPDEIANEKTLANALNELYESCSETITGVCGNINAIGEAWKSFQAGNTIEGGIAADISLVKKIAEVKVNKADLNIKVKDKHFGPDENLGLKNGAASAAKLTDAITSYAKDVYSKVEGLYAELDANKAFLGEDQAPKITNYLHEMGKAIAKLTVCIKSVKDAIGKAAEAYKSQATSTSDQVSGLKTDIDTDQSIV